MKKETLIYTIISTGADADRGFFPEPEAHGSFLSIERARAEMWRLAAEENETLDSRYDSTDDGDDYWERYRNGEAAALFSRIEILTSQLMDGSDLA